MNENDRSCPEGRDSLALLAYLEGDLGPETRLEIEDHLRVCAWCRTELEHLRRADAVLRTHPEAFHPDMEDLHRFATTGVDPDGVVADHLAVCDACWEDVSLLKRLAQGGVEAESAPRMPAALKARMRALAREASAGAWWRRAWERVAAAWTGLPRVPMLAAGTAAAVIVVAVLVAPLLKSTKEVPPSRVDHLKELPKQSAEPPVSESVRREPRMLYRKSNDALKPPMAEPPSPALPAPSGGPAPRARAPVFGDEAQTKGRLEGVPQRFKQPAAETPAPGRALPVAPAQREEKIETAQPRVRIVDEHGRDISWLHVDPSLVAGMYGYRAHEKDKAKMDRESLDVREPAKMERRVERAEPEEGLSVLVRVLPDGPVFTVEASLSTTDATQTKTRSEARVPKQKLQETIDALVRALLTESK